MIGLSIALGALMMDGSQYGRGNVQAKLPSSAVDPINYFGTDALTKLARTGGGKNIMISPWSLQECFGMVRLGARGQTDDELSAFLKQPLSSVLAGKNLAQVRGTVAPLMKTDQIREANGLWVSKGFPLKAQFKQDAMTYFGAPTHETTFPNPGVGQINQFVSDTTRGKIPKLVGELPANTRLVLVNAVSFLDKWAEPFKKANTKNMDFRVANGSVKQVPTMTASGRYAYAEGPLAQTVWMPYKSGWNMAIVLPRKGVSLDKVLAQPNLAGAVTDFGRRLSGSVFIPRWKSEFTWDLKKWMMQQGVKHCFDMGANFTGISKEGLFIGEALQKTYIRVDEEGTEAAAATGIMMPTGAIVQDKPFEFRADHPFAYFIYSPSGVIYFAGVVNNPST